MYFYNMLFLEFSFFFFFNLIYQKYENYQYYFFFIGILYVMWCYFVYNSEVKCLFFLCLESNGDKWRCCFMVDCFSFSKGLFLGILLFVIVVIFLKLFFSFVKVNLNGLIVLFVFYCMEIGFYMMVFISMVVVVF